MGTRETGFTASMPGYRAYDDPAARAELAALLGVDEARLPDRAGPRLPRHRQRGHVRTDQGPLGHRHQPGRVVPEPRGARESRSAAARPARRAGRLRDADHRARRRRAAGGDLGREGRHLHQQRAPGVAGCGPRSRRRARPAPTSTSCWPSPSAGAAATSCSPAGRRRATPSRSGGACRPAGRATTAASPGSASTRPAACSGRARPTTRPCPLGGTARLYTDGRFHRPGGRPAVRAVEPEPIRDAPAARVPAACSTPAAPSSTGTPARRPAGCRSSRRLAPEAWVEVHPDRRRRRSACAPATSCGSARRAARSTGIRARVTADRAARRGVHPVPLGRALRQPAHRRRVRPDQPGAELQAVRRADRAGRRGVDDRASRPGNAP